MESYLDLQVLVGILSLFGVGEKEREERREGRRGHRPSPSPIRTRPLGAAQPALGSPSLFLVWPNKAQYFSRRIPVTLRYFEKYPNHSEPFRSPNIVVQYIDLYVSTISRLLVMSLISSGTPNSFDTSKLINS